MQTIYYQNVMTTVHHFLADLTFPFDRFTKAQITKKHDFIYKQFSQTSDNNNPLLYKKRQSTYL